MGGCSSTNNNHISLKQFEEMIFQYLQWQDRNKEESIITNKIVTKIKNIN